MAKQKFLVLLDYVPRACDPYPWVH